MSVNRILHGRRDLVLPNPECPNAADHTPHPRGYVSHAEWAEEMLKTHEQVRCDGCGRFNVWRRKAAG